jgi:Na+/phosphate symporter
MLVPLQVIDDFLLQYHVGQVLVLVFVLGLLATLPLKNRTAIGLHVVVFGLIFLLTPLSLMGSDVTYKLAGLALLFVGPMIIVVGR